MREILDKKLSQILNDNNIAGMSVTVTDRQKVIYSSGFGVESTERPDVPTLSDTLYRVASVTKMVTGLTVMKLCEDEVLDLDAPVSEYVTWLKLPRSSQCTMTLRMLLSHMAGLPQEYTPDGPREESALEDTLKEELSAVDMVSYPGEGKYLYSNLGIRLAAYIAELKTGKPYSILARELVLEPLGMHNSTYDLRVAATYPLSLPHDDVGGKLIPQHYIKENSARLAAGGLYSNTNDLSKLARCILNDGKSDSGTHVVSKNTLCEMLTPVSIARNDGVDGYGLTMMTNNYKDGVMVGHLGDAHPYGASVFADRQKGMAVVTLMNTFRSDVRCQIPEMILGMM